MTREISALAKDMLFLLGLNPELDLPPNSSVLLDKYMEGQLFAEILRLLAEHQRRRADIIRTTYP